MYASARRQIPCSASGEGKRSGMTCSPVGLRAGRAGETPATARPRGRWPIGRPHHSRAEAARRRATARAARAVAPPAPARYDRGRGSSEASSERGQVAMENPRRWHEDQGPSRTEPVGSTAIVINWMLLKGLDDPALAEAMEIVRD